eukprot:TRINITY_DN12806_c0_g1_i3.p2 TRINITY_DN12806_c0_g1~~TRINITY_DN12806_c0_g1_i3.p2  ORF type:complete len:212 (-),score=22.11 TRINITY_DN12806_c0_g1_i3:13-648(-)
MIGHAWGATSFFFLAFQFKKPIFWVLAALMFVLTCFSRVYFGVHYPHDILGGFMCGAVSVFMYIAGQRLFQSVSTKRKWDATRMMSIFAGLLICSMAVINYFVDPKHRLIQPGLAFVPFCLIGFVLCQPYIPDIGRSSKRHLCMRLLVGLPGVFCLFPIYYFFGPVAKAFSAAFLGVWVFSLAPLVFKRLGLVATQEVVDVRDTNIIKKVK